VRARRRRVQPRPAGQAREFEKYLVDRGVDANRLTAHGYGETQPLDRRSNEAAWAKNRRVAFLILKRSSD
jgi:outer membrane protein OmpA-like peptidoglycan-associated protein